MPKQVRLSPKFKWMEPYIQVGMSYVSSEHILERVGAWDITKSRGKNVHAAIYQNRKGSGHRIWLQTHFHHGHKNEIRPFSKIDLLNSLAHELAHMEDWKHTPKHNYLEAKIKAAFSKMLAKEGYVSEEEELK